MGFIILIVFGIGLFGLGLLGVSITMLVVSYKRKNELQRIGGIILLVIGPGLTLLFLYGN